jgi:hypothetical protein
MVPDSAHGPNNKLILSPLCIRRILSAMTGLTSMTVSFEHALLFLVWGIVLVTLTMNGKRVSQKQSVGEVYARPVVRSGAGQ